MANFSGAAGLSSIMTESYDTALCIIPPQWQCRSIDQLRSLYDKSYGKWPAHINLIYPFVNATNLPVVKERFQSFINQQFTGKTLDVVLDQADHFVQRKNCTVFLTESQSTEETQIEVLRRNLFRLLGQDPKPSRLHLTIGQSENRTASAVDFFVNKAKLIPKLKFQVFSLAILVREYGNRDEISNSRMRLWGTVEVSAISLPQYSLTEFWIPSENTTKPYSSSPIANLTNASNITDAANTLNSHVRPEKTYRFDAATQLWQPFREISQQAQLTQLTISSYNVLFELESAAPTDKRYPSLASTIVSKSAQADLIVLQEVTDNFLSYLLSDQDVQQHFPFTSHGPPNQSDIGPLLNICNIVILSRHAFTWEMLKFPGKHKEAVIAAFNVLSKNGQHAIATPVIVTGVHLTCGVTDTAIASKHVQLTSLMKSLSEKYPTSPWIIAGDFNIPTSSYTIDDALANKSISEESVETLYGMEARIGEIGLVDAWSAAGTEAISERSERSLDLYEGEYGATFDPTTNELAAATSRTSSNRPQRYDRILLQPRGLLEVHGFNLFGLPQDQGSTYPTPSDHFGVRATIQIMDSDLRSSAVRKALPARSAIKWKLPKSRIADVSSLTAVLKAHNMFPSETETVQRQEAFSLVKEILLGDLDKNEMATMGISIVVASVGSYALETWTSSSDIDCLCIGTISSKNFFKLARKQIAEASDKGAHVLRMVEARTGTMLELMVNGVYMDLQYCPAAQIAERWSAILDLDPSNDLFNMSMLSRRKLKPFLDISYIQRCLPSLPNFRLAYRCIKLWASQHGIYSAKFGYLGGIHITLMLASVYMRIAHDIGEISATDLLVAFFNYYAEFDWRCDIVYDPFFHKERPQYQRKAREPMVILGFHTPNSNVAHTATSPGLDILITELKTAAQRLSQEQMTWSQFFTDTTSPKEAESGAMRFLRSHDIFVRITIHYWGPSSSKAKGLLGWVESRCINLVVDIDRVLSNATIRIWPARFTDQNIDIDSEGDYQGCYLIGIAKEVGVNVKHDRYVIDPALTKAVNRFQDQMQATDTEYDPAVSWIDVSITEPSQVETLELDTRQWGDYTAGLDYPTEEEEEDEDDNGHDIPTPEPYQIRTQQNAATRSFSTTSKLRPASDILSRLKWDSKFNPSDYVVGYEDRFLGARETNLEKWKMEQTDEEFIPQHRILYFKDKKNGVVVWERQTRIDMIFGSGASASGSKG